MVWLDIVVAGNTVEAYLWSVGVGLGSWFVLWLLKRYGLHVMKRTADRTETEIDDALLSVFDVVDTVFFAAVSFWAGVQMVATSVRFDYWLDIAVLVVATIYGVRAVSKLIDALSTHAIEVRDRTSHSLITVLGRLVKGVVWVVAFLFVLSNAGINVSTFIAGLGVGGVAIAFALQNILGDIFASFSIYFDEPFEVGDFIIIGEDMGVVEHIGIKSTRIKTLKGQELVVSNAELTSARVNNFKKMERRRIQFEFGVRYDTPVEKLKQIPDMVEEIVADIERADLDRAHFREFGDSALEYEVVYYVDTSDYNTYMDIQEEINLGLTERFQEHDIEFAFPTRRVIMDEGEERKS